MEEFLSMIYRTYTENNGCSKSYLGDQTVKLMDELDAILSDELVRKIDDLFIDASAEIEKMPLWMVSPMLVNAFQTAKLNFPMINFSGGG